MNAYIDKIFILNKESEIRDIDFKPGLNIITGDSKTGKSALIEIVDYCFCSKTSSIPKGVISDYGYIFGIIIRFSTKYLIIGRKNYSEGGYSRIYVTISSEKLQKIDLDYFNKLEPYLIKDGKIEIEKHFGLSVLNMSTSNDVDSRDKRKASLREMTSFIFQHQNLIANKHALFYRFDDNFKRKATVDSFPIFAGWVTDEYFSILRELEDKKKELKKLLTLEKRQQKTLQHIDNELKIYFKNYYNLVGAHFDENWDSKKLMALIEDLPKRKKVASDMTKLLERYNISKKRYHELGASISIMQKQLKEIEETERHANDFQYMLYSLKNKSENSNPAEYEYKCPTCGLHNEKLTNEMQELNTAKASLETELKNLSGYSISFQKEKDSLKREIIEQNKSLKTVGLEIKEIEKISDEIKKQKNLDNQVIYSKAKLELRVELFNHNKIVIYDKEINSIKADIEELKRKLGNFNITSEISEAQSFISSKMNQVAVKLDFEDELTPIDFFFDLNEFQFYHTQSRNSKERILLSEMGSGANWITCHLSLFCSFLHYFAKQKKSKIPSFLFLDQPSQVYFPSEFSKDKGGDNDIKQVEKIYTALLDKVNEIYKDVKFYPQIIVTDHADNLDLGKYNFEDYVVKRWKPNYDGKLI